MLTCRPTWRMSAPIAEFSKNYWLKWKCFWLLGKGGSRSQDGLVEQQVCTIDWFFVGMQSNSFFCNLWHVPHIKYASIEKKKLKSFQKFKTII